MKQVTRRTFLTTSGISAGVGLMAGAQVSGESATPDGVSAISSNFNGTPIPAGDFIWFSSVLKVQGLDSDPVTIGFAGSIQFAVNGSLYLVSVPTAIVNFSPFVATASTVYCNGQWVTTVPLSGLSGNVFLDGVAFQAPPPSGFPGGIKQVTWQGTFFSLTPGIKVQWQWAASVYHNANFGADYNLLGVKPVDDSNASLYFNSDHAGTPENFKTDVEGGARGGGGSNFTGSYSGTAATVPAPANIGAACGGS